MFRWVSKIFSKNREARGYQDLMAQRLRSDWFLNGDDPNQRLRQSFCDLRSMSRDLAETNQYAVTYTKAVQSNIIGPEGIKLQSQVMAEDGEKDEAARTLIENRWADWKLPENCTIGCRSHYNDEERMRERTLAVDGEVFIWVFIGHNVNAHQFATRTLEADHIDHDYNIPKLPNGNQITMGVEHTMAGKVVAYWVTMEHPGALQQTYNGRKRSRIPALSEWMGDEITEPASTGYILHQYEVKRAGQMRGIPDLAAVMSPMRKLVKTEDGHHDQAQLSSYAVFQRVSTNADEDERDEVQGSPVIKPASIIDAGLGKKYEVMQPAAPNSSMPDHGKYTLKGMSAALGLAYPGFSGDLEGTSFSSGRAGAAIERDNWKVGQNRTINCRNRPLFNAHLRAQLVYGLLGADYFPGSDEQRLRAARWQARGWGFINPLQDINAFKTALEIEVTSPQRIIRDRGDDPEEVLREIAEWKEAAGNDEPADATGEDSADTENRILELSEFSENDPLASENPEADIVNG